MIDELAKQKSRAEFYKGCYLGALCVLKHTSTSKEAAEYVEASMDAAAAHEVMWNSEAAIETEKTVVPPKAQDANETMFTNHMPF